MLSIYFSKMKSGRSKAVIILVLILLGIVTCVCPVMRCEEIEESRVFQIDMAIYINNLFFDNDTAKIDVELWIRNFPINASVVQIKFQSLEYYQLNCILMGGFPDKYQFQGKLEQKSWYLYGIGELFPFDYHFLEFRLDPYYIQYKINGTTYGMRDLNYTFVEEHTHADFAGLFRPRLKDQWEIFRYSTNQTYYVYFFRREEMSSLQFLIPIFLTQVLVVLTPSFTDNKSIRIRLFSSILLFVPMFIFAIQDFLPHRSTLSIPEFLGLGLIFSCTLMILSSLLGDPKRETWTFAFDAGGLIFSYIFYWLLIRSVYEGRMVYIGLPHVRPVFYLASGIFLVGVMYRLVGFYRKPIRHTLREVIQKLYQKIKRLQG